MDELKLHGFEPVHLINESLVKLIETTQNEPTISPELENKLKQTIIRLTRYKYILKWNIPSLCDACKQNPPIITLHNPQIDNRPEFLCRHCGYAIERLAKEAADSIGIQFVK